MVFGDRQQVLQQALNGCGFIVACTCDVHKVLGQEDQWAETLRAQQPDLVWIALLQPSTVRSKRNDRRARKFAVRMARAQDAAHRQFILESDVQSNVWHALETSDLTHEPTWHDGVVRWCNLGVTDEYGRPAAVATRIVSNREYYDADADCHCGRPAADHVTYRTVADRRDLTGRGISALAARLTLRYLPSGATGGEEQAATDDSRPGTHSRRQRRRRGVIFADEVDDSDFKVESLASSYPTQQRVRDKERRAADPEGEVRRRPQMVEQHCDDCGSDFSILLVLDGHTCDDECHGPELDEWDTFDEQPFLMI